MPRWLEVILAALLLCLFFPLQIILSVLVWRNFGRPVIFSQLRPGLRGRVFRMYKFRSMTEEKDSQGRDLPDEQRLNSFGRFLRSSSLDELPGLWNVLKGDMSFVGPRPLLVEYLPLYNSEQSRRHDVKPGLTGWAQVNGRNAISWDERFTLDVWYIDHRSFVLDVKILFLTVVKVLSREGVSSRDSVTMTKFTGNK